MKLFRIFAIVALAMISGASAQAGVVLSNFSAPLSGNNDDNNGTSRSATGFTVGSGLTFTVDSVGGRIFGVSPGSSVSMKMGIYSDLSGSPNLSNLVAESASLTVGDVDFHTFLFSGGSGNRVLTAGTYWAVLTEVGASSSWYRAGTGIAPTDPNSPLSGITYAGSKETADMSSWTTTTNIKFFELAGTVSNNAVPEPALTSLLCLGGVALIRRRMKK